jgi:hypothetical protein
VGSAHRRHPLFLDPAAAVTQQRQYRSTPPV